MFFLVRLWKVSLSKAPPAMLPSVRSEQARDSNP